MSQSICLVANYVFSAENKKFTHSWEEMITETDMPVKFLNCANMVQQLRLRQGQCEEAEVKSHKGQSLSVLEVTISLLPHSALLREDTSDAPPSPQPLCLSQPS